MTDFRLLNGKKKATIIERFDNTVRLICPDLSRKDFETLHDCKTYIESQGWEINVAHIRQRVSANG